MIVSQKDAYVESAGHRLRVLYTEQEIAHAIETMAEKIARASQVSSNGLTVIPLLRGSFIFAADLVRALSRAGLSPFVDFMILSSYGEGTESSGQVLLRGDIEDEIAGRDVLLVDDILESGRTLAFAKNWMREKGAASARIAALLEKPGKRKVDLQADYIGFTVPDLFVVGYGLDWAGKFRELPYIGVVEPK